MLARPSLCGALALLASLIFAAVAAVPQLVATVTLAKGATGHAEHPEWKTVPGR